jgi:hypothetical protein
VMRSTGDGGETSASEARRSLMDGSLDMLIVLYRNRH